MILRLPFFVVWFIGFASPAVLAESVPPPPEAHFNDYTGSISPEVARQLDQRLADYERTSSNQLLVAVFPRMDSPSSVFDYTQRVAASWRVGQAGRDNGAVLFVFLRDREVFLQVGYGLEAVLPDATAKRIIEEEIVPRFRAGDLEGGLSAAVGAMIAATQGEYQGSGRTAGETRRGSSPGRHGAEWLFIVVLVVLSAVFGRGRRRSIVIGPRGRFGRSLTWSMGPSLGRRSGGGWGGLGGGGGGGFSGGGGRFGGGGAGGRW